MTSGVERFIDELTIQYAQRGEGTGGVSKILSTLTFPILTVLAVQLVKEQHYLVLLLIAVLMWTKIGAAVILAGLVYFLATKYWSGAAIVTAYLIVASLSMYFGKRNIKRLLLSGKPLISPFEGMPHVLLILVFECVSLALAMLTHGWISAMFWGLTMVIALHHVGRYWFRMHPRWRQIHGPLMIRYAGFAGLEAGRSELEKRSFDFRTVIANLLRSVYPEDCAADIEALVSSASEQMRTFRDRDLLRSILQRRHPTVPMEMIEGVLDKTNEYLQSDEGKKRIVDYAVAAVVESVFGENDRGEYLADMIEGKAR